MADILRLVYRDDDATIHADLWDPTGANNPQGLRTKVRTIDWGTLQDDEQFARRVATGGEDLVHSFPPGVEGTHVIKAWADTWDELDAGLAAFRQAFADLDGKTFLWQPQDQADPEYVDLITASIPPILRSQGHDDETRALRSAITLEVPIAFRRHPYSRLAEVITTPLAVPNNPATPASAGVSAGRTYRVSNPDATAPTPAIVKITGDAGSTIQEIIIGRLSGSDALLDDYESETKYAPLDSDRAGWDITHYGDTDSVADAAAAHGNTARIDYDTSPTVMARRVRATRTTKLDSMRGLRDWWVRLETTVDDLHVLSPRWGPSLADPPAHTLPDVQFEPAGSATFSYVDVYLGRIWIPEDVPLGAVAFELHSRSEDANALLYPNYFFFLPVEDQAVVQVPGGSTETFLGSELVTPVANPAGGTAGTVYGTALLLDTTTDNAGVPPNTGRVLGAGRHRFLFRVLSSQSGGGGSTVVVRVRNISDSSTWLTATILFTGSFMTKTVALEGTLPDGANAAADLYQEQVDDPSVSNGAVVSVVHEVVPFVASTESARTDPSRGAVEKLDSAGAFLQELSLRGSVPIMLPPAESTLVIIPRDVKVDSFSPGLESKLGRSPTVEVTFSPRKRLG